MEKEMVAASIPYVIKQKEEEMMARAAKGESTIEDLKEIIEVALQHGDIDLVFKAQKALFDMEKKNDSNE